MKKELSVRLLFFTQCYRFYEADQASFTTGGSIKLDKKELAQKCVDLLEKEYPDAICSLEYVAAHELLISTRLAAQCTDARVNMVTPTLFARFPSIDAFAQADITEVEEIIKTCGLYKTKARDIVNMCIKMRDEYHSKVPDNMEDLLTLPGIGRKTANLVLGDFYGKPAVVCDTHCIRLTNRIGLATGKDPYKVEMQLRDCLPMEKANDFCHRLVLHGRAVCKARGAACEKCCLQKICATGKETLHPGLRKEA